MDLADRDWLPGKAVLFAFLWILLSLGEQLAVAQKNAPGERFSGTRLSVVQSPLQYSDGRPVARYRLDAKDYGIVMRHGNGPRGCDSLGARDIWVWQHRGVYYMHYDGAGARGWLACLATSRNAATWKKSGPALDFGERGQKDAASAS
jgi:hypothetical protein